MHNFVFHPYVKFAAYLYDFNFVISCCNLVEMSIHVYRITYTPQKISILGLAALHLDQETEIDITTLKINMYILRVAAHQSR